MLPRSDPNTAQAWLRRRLGLLSPALALTASVPGSDPVALAAGVPGSNPIALTAPRPGSDQSGLACTILPGPNLGIAALVATAGVTRVRRHRSPMCALGGNVPAGGFARFALGHCETCKATDATEDRNGEEYLDHVPTSIAKRLA